VACEVGRGRFLSKAQPQPLQLELFGLAIPSWVLTSSLHPKVPSLCLRECLIIQVFTSVCWNMHVYKCMPQHVLICMCMCVHD